jgi:hypothetical protein
MTKHCADTINLQGNRSSRSAADASTRIGLEGGHVSVAPMRKLAMLSGRVLRQADLMTARRFQVPD